LHAAARYDFLLWLLTLGRESAFREKMLRFAALQPGDSVLDIGCGTGTLAIAAKRQVGVDAGLKGHRICRWISNNKILSGGGSKNSKKDSKRFV